MSKQLNYKTPGYDLNIASDWHVQPSYFLALFMVTVCELFLIEKIMKLEH
jgi:hypothetical protein